MYGRQRALQPVDLTLEPNQITALLGENGAGKSTLLGILATLISPSSGEVLYHAPGNVALEDQALRRTIGVIAHDSFCYGDLTGRENLSFFSRLYRVADAMKRTDALLARVGIEAAADRPARTYSRGMMQRLAVARALIHSPAILLCDEPFTGLDRSGVQMFSQILREERGRGAIVLVVTHEFEAIAGLVDRVLVLSRGALVHDGPAPSACTAVEIERIYTSAQRLRAPSAAGTGKG